MPGVDKNCQIAVCTGIPPPELQQCVNEIYRRGWCRLDQVVLDIEAVYFLENLSQVLFEGSNIQVVVVPMHEQDAHLLEGCGMGIEGSIYGFTNVLLILFDIPLWWR